MHGAAERNADGLAGRTTATVIDSLRSDLLTHLDAAYPDYVTARATAAPGQRLASRLEDSGAGTTAGGLGSERAKAITRPIFNQNPQALVESRDAFAAAGRDDEWNAGVRSHLQGAIDKVSMSQQGLNPSMLLRNVWNNPDTRSAMQSAMTPDQFTGFDQLMDTIQDASRTYPMNSLTDMRKNAGPALDAAGADNQVSKLVSAVGTLTSVLRVLDVGGRIAARPTGTCRPHGSRDRGQSVQPLEVYHKVCLAFFRMSKMRRCRKSALQRAVE